MSYNRGKNKIKNNQKKRVYYRFEGMDISKMPDDIDWMQIAKDKKEASKAIDKYPYWFQRGTKEHLNKTRQIGQPG